MPKDDTYNGWTNYPTWAVKLWLDNAEPAYRYWTETAHKLREAGPQPIAGTSLTREPRGILADRLKEAIEDSLPDLGASMASDLLGYAIGTVNWYEIAENLLAE